MNSKLTAPTTEFHGYFFSEEFMAECAATKEQIRVEEEAAREREASDSILYYFGSDVCLMPASFAEEAGEAAKPLPAFINAECPWCYRAMPAEAIRRIIDDGADARAALAPYHSDDCARPIARA